MNSPRWVIGFCAVLAAAGILLAVASGTRSTPPESIPVPPPSPASAGEVKPPAPATPPSTPPLPVAVTPKPEAPKVEKEPVFKGRTAAQWAKEFESKQPAARMEALYAIGRLAPAGQPVLPLIIGMTKDPEWPVRSAAAKCLGAYGPLAREALQPLTEMLQDNNSFHIRREAIVALGAMGQEARSATAAIKPFLRDSKSHAQTHAAEALCKIGGDGPAMVVERVDELLKVHNWPEAGSLIRLLPPAGAGMAPHLVRWLHLTAHEDYSACAAAIKALGDLGPAAKAVTPELKTLPRSVMIYGLLKLAPAEVDGAKETPELIAELGRYRYFDFDAAGDALALIGRPAMPELLKALKAGHAYSEFPVIVTLGKLGAEGRDAVPLLVEKLKTAKEEKRRAIIKTLGGIGAEARAALPLLRAELRDPASKDRACAATALGCMGAAAQEAVAELSAALKSDDSLLKQEARIALDKIKRANAGFPPPKEEDF